MLSIKNNLEKINKQIVEVSIACGRTPESVQLIAVSKRKSVEKVLEGIKSGAKHLGENYIQEAIEKIDIIGKDSAVWHFIGHLQSNKAKIAVKYFEYIHTVDTLKLGKEINKQAIKIDKIQKILLQVNISDEQTKSGTSIHDAIELAKGLSAFENLSLQGLMCMPPYFSEPEEARIYFKNLSHEEIDFYINTDEPFDKAGGYGIQGIGSFMVKRIAGSYSNVVGLPVCELVETLKELNIIHFKDLNHYAIN
jgi:pyridoxal phosphate enzyme (YggS family)